MLEERTSRGQEGEKEGEQEQEQGGTGEGARSGGRGYLSRNALVHGREDGCARCRDSWMQ